MAARSWAGSAGLQVLCFTSGALASAQTRGQVEAISSHWLLETGGAHVQELRGVVPPPPPITGLSVSGALWAHPDNGEYWVGRVVALGNHGTNVFTEFDTAADRAELLSGFDIEPVTPIWNNWLPSTSQDAKVDAAELTGDLVSCRQVPVTGLTGPRNVIVSKYSATNATADWTYTFPATTQAVARACISKDGSRIVAGMLDGAANLIIAVFQSSSPVPTSVTTIPIGPQLRAFLLSADGSTVYFASGTMASVWDVATRSTVAAYVLLQSLDAHAISGNGSVFAYGGFNTVNIYRRQAAGNYAPEYVLNVPGQAVCGRVEISENSSTVVAGFNLWDTQLGVKILAVDVASHATTMTDTALGTGTYQNIVSDIAVSASGDRFAVGLWGDQGGACPELRLYRRNQDAPAALYDYPGSVFDVDISSDGNRVAVASKAVHANVYAGGGEIALFAFEDEDFVAQGIPVIGDKVRFTMSGTPGAPARLIVAPAPAITPFNFNPIGVLYLQRFSMTLIPIGTTDASGLVDFEYQLPNNPALIGANLCFQGLITVPRRLTRNWVQLTVLP